MKRNNFSLRKCMDPTSETHDDQMVVMILIVQRKDSMPEMDGFY